MRPQSNPPRATGAVLEVTQRFRQTSLLAQLKQITDEHLRVVAKWQHNDITWCTWSQQPCSCARPASENLIVLD
jgi:hypothetical protein